MPLVTIKATKPAGLEVLGEQTHVQLVQLATVSAGVLSLASGAADPGSSGITELGAVANVAAAAMAPTLAATAAKTNYIAGFNIDGLGATAASVIEATITGGVGGVRRYKVDVPAGATAALARPVRVEFSRPIAASAVNTAITLDVPSFGAGNTSAVSEVHGFQR